MENFIRKFAKITYVSNRGIGRFFYICIAAFSVLMMLAFGFSDGLSVFGLLRVLLLVSIPVAYLLTAEESSVPTMAVMVLYAAVLLLNFPVKSIASWGYLISIAFFVLAHRFHVFLTLAKIVSLITMTYCLVNFFLPVFSDIEMHLDGMRSINTILGTVLFSPLLAMSMFGWKQAEAGEDTYHVKIVGVLLIVAAVVMVIGVVFNWVIKFGAESQSETVYYDANGDGELNSGEWWGILDGDGDEHWYREGYKEEYHIPAN